MTSKKNLPIFHNLQFEKFAYQLLHYIDDDITEEKVKKMNQKFQEYKHKVTVCGAILYNQDQTKVLLISSSNTEDHWTFPKGKINQGETEVDCAVREVWEEIGFRINDMIDPSYYCDYNRSGKLTKLFIIRGVKENYNFITKSIGEVARIQWFDIHTIKKDPSFKKIIVVLNKANKVKIENSLMKTPLTSEEIEQNFLKEMKPPLSNLEIESEFSKVLFEDEEDEYSLENLLNTKKDGKKISKVLFEDEEDKYSLETDFKKDGKQKKKKKETSEEDNYSLESLLNIKVKK